MNKKKSTERGSKKISDTPEQEVNYIPSTAGTERTHDDIIRGFLEDVFTPDSEFKKMLDSENPNKSNLKPLGDASKIDCKTAREVMKRLLDGEDIFDAQLRGDAIDHMLHCDDCDNYISALMDEY